MDGIRAKKIADRFSGNQDFIVNTFSGGLLVHHHQHTHYFVRESCFWAYVYKQAGLPV